MDLYPIPQSVRSQLKPRELCSVTDWCDRNRYLSARFTFEPGYWRTARTPYLAEIMDSTDDEEVGEIVFIKCARVGGTEAINNTILHTAAQKPKPVLYVQPTREDVEDEFKGRVRSMIEDCEALREQRLGAHWATSDHIRLAGCDIYGAWPTNPQTMVRKTIGLVIFDEIDNAEAQAGYLGNSLKVLRERLVNAEEWGLLFVNGTPTVESAAGWRLLLESDRRTYRVPCPCCGGYQPLVFGQLKVAKDWRDHCPPSGLKKPTPDMIERYQLARYHCIHCEKPIVHAESHGWMIDRGVWVPHELEVEEVLPLGDDEIVTKRSLAVRPQGVEAWRPSLSGPLPQCRTRGYHINVLYSPFRSRTWSHTLAEFFRVREKPDELRVFKNSWLAEPWSEVAQQLDVKVIGNKRSWPAAEARRVVPSRGIVSFMGLDVQPDRCYYTIRCHGAGEETWGIDEGELHSQGIGPDRVVDLDLAYRLAFETGFPTRRTLDYLRAKYGPDAAGLLMQPERLTDEDLQYIQLMRCRALAVDSGYAARLDEVKTFAQRPGVAMIKGQSSQQYGWRRQAGDPFRRSDQQADLFLVNVDHYRERIHRRLRLAEDHPQAFHLCRDASDEYVEHLCAMHQTLETVTSGRRKGQRELAWRLRTQGARKDKLDCEIYGLFVADLFRVIDLRPGQAIADCDLLEVRSAIKSPKPNSRASRNAGHGSGYLG